MSKSQLNIQQNGLSKLGIQDEEFHQFTACRDKQAALQQEACLQYFQYVDW